MKKYLAFLAALLIVSNAFGYALFRTNSYNQSTDFPDSVNHNGNLFGFQAPTVEGNWNGVYGGVNLTRTGELANTNDYLGNDRFMEFDGSNDYLSSDSASLSSNGSFSLAFVLAISDWTTPAYGGVLSRTNGTTGWVLYLNNTTKTLSFNSVAGGAGTEQVTVDVSSLPSGPHHFAITRDTANTKSAIYIDGLLVARSGVATAFTAAGNFEVGKYTIGSNYFLTGSLQNIWVHKGVAWTPNQVKKLWARGSRLFATEKADGTLANIVSPLEGKSFLYTLSLLGSTENPSGGTVAKSARYYVVGDTVTYLFSASMKSGTNGSGGFRISLPITVVAESGLQGSGYLAGVYRGANLISTTCGYGTNYSFLVFYRSDTLAALSWGTANTTFDGSDSSASEIYGTVTYPWR